MTYRVRPILIRGNLIPGPHRTSNEIDMTLDTTTFRPRVIYKEFTYVLHNRSNFSLKNVN